MLTLFYSMGFSEFIARKVMKHITKEDLPFIENMLKPKIAKVVPKMVEAIRKTGYDFVHTDFKTKKQLSKSRCDCLPELEESFGTVEDLKSKNEFGVDLSEIDPEMIERFMLSFVYTLDEQTLTFTAYVELIFGMLKFEYKVNPKTDGTTDWPK